MQFCLKVPQHLMHNACMLDMHQGLGSYHFARRYLGNHCCFIFHEVLRYFSSLGCLSYTYEFSVECLTIPLSGLSHSEIPGSKDVTSLPGLIAGSRVLHRL